MVSTVAKYELETFKEWHGQLSFRDKKIPNDYMFSSIVNQYKCLLDGQGVACDVFYGKPENHHLCYFTQGMWTAPIIRTSDELDGMYYLEVYEDCQLERNGVYYALCIGYTNDRIVGLFLVATNDDIDYKVCVHNLKEHGSFTDEHYENYIEQINKIIDNIKRLPKEKSIMTQQKYVAVSPTDEHVGHEKRFMHLTNGEPVLGTLTKYDGKYVAFYKSGWYEVATVLVEVE